MSEPGALLTPEQRRERLSQAIARDVANGWRIESQSEYAATLVAGEKTNHVLHLLISIFTCGCWVFVWALIAARGGIKRKSMIAPQYDVPAQELKAPEDMSTHELLDSLFAGVKSKAAEIGAAIRRPRQSKKP